jgi:cell division protein FtsL
MASPEAKKIITWNRLLFIFGVILAIKTALNIYQTYNRADARVTEINSEVEIAMKANDELKKQLEDTISTENIEKQAKERLGLGKLDEIILVLPEQVVTSNQLSVISTPNWRLWWDLYMR